MAQLTGQRFPRTANKTDFGLTAHKTIIPLIWNEVGRLTVPAGQQIAVGVGGLGQTDSREPVYIRFDKCTNTQMTGIVRVIIADANLINKKVVFEQRTERLSASENDKSSAFLLGESLEVAGEDAKIIIEFYTDAITGTESLLFDDTDTKILMPLTIYYARK